jgi:hypothetical protein
MNETPKLAQTALDRRELLLAAGGLAGTGLLAGCSGDDEPRPVDAPLVTNPDRLEGDLAVAALLVSLENLLVVAYQEGLDNEERIGPIPPASMAYVETALQQHKEHSVAWNSILTGAGKPAITGVNLTVKSATADPVLARMRDTVAFLAMCQDLETVTAGTYLAALGSIANNAVLKVAASIHPVENAHVTSLAFLLARGPFPEGFGRTDGARPTSDSIG